jgi:hypothetical protein
MSNNLHNTYEINYSNYSNYNNYTHNNISINDIKDYDDLDIEIMFSLIDIKEPNNLIGYYIDNINFEVLSENEFNKLLVDVSNENIDNIRKYIKIRYSF